MADLTGKLIVFALVFGDASDAERGKCQNLQKTNAM